MFRLIFEELFLSLFLLLDLFSSRKVLNGSVSTFRFLLAILLKAKYNFINMCFFATVCHIQACEKVQWVGIPQFTDDQQHLSANRLCCVGHHPSLLCEHGEPFPLMVSNCTDSLGVLKNYCLEALKGQVG